MGADYFCYLFVHAHFDVSGLSVSTFAKSGGHLQQ
jgi:hypothetical protein